jgi:hypothetical protein
MAPIVENWSRITGCVESWTPPDRSDGPGSLDVRVERVDEVVRPAGHVYANLLAGCEGRVVQIEVPAVVACSLDIRAGDRIQVQVRRGRSPERLFARPGSVSTQPAP